MVSLTMQFTGVCGVYGGPRSPSLSPPWFMVHTVHRTAVPAPPLASSCGDAPAGGERPFSSHSGSSTALQGSTEPLVHGELDGAGNSVVWRLQRGFPWRRVALQRLLRPVENRQTASCPTALNCE
jgi:hypothetical protein